VVELKQIIELKIDRLTYGGDGIGKTDNFVVFVENSAIGDLLKVEITEVKKSFARGKIVKIIEPSPTRVEPRCKLIEQCGGCNWQHIDYKNQLEAKKEAIEYNIKNIGKLDIPVKDVLPSNSTYNYRCKVQYHVEQSKSSDIIKIGYYEKGAHHVVDIDNCPIQPKIIDKITNHICENSKGILTYNDKNKTGLLKHIVLTYSMSKNELVMIFVLNSTKIPQEIKDLAQSCSEKFPEIVGTLANFNTMKTSRILGREMRLISGQDYVTEVLEDKTYRITAGSFFQVNPASAIRMFNTVKDIIVEKTEKPTILDVYAGVASFAIWLKDIASDIIAIEEHPQAIKDAIVNIGLNKKIEGSKIKMIKGNADRVLKDLEREGKSFDVVVLDPPRTGCSLVALDSVAKLAAKYIIYVSCNPATLARDLKLLSEKGFKAEYIQPIDMFCHTYHVESIAVLKK
jgi:23S rRNA (uracil1939-C5)-methyltransferase